MYSTDEVLNVAKTIVRMFTTKISSKEDMEAIENELPSDLKNEILATVISGMMIHMMTQVAEGKAKFRPNIDFGLS